MEDPTQAMKSSMRNIITEPNGWAVPRVLVGPSVTENQSIESFDVYGEQFFIILLEDRSLPERPTSIIIWHADTNETWVCQVRDTAPVYFSLSGDHLLIGFEDGRYLVYIFTDCGTMFTDPGCPLFVDDLDHAWSIVANNDIHISVDETRHCDFLKYHGEIEGVPVAPLWLHFISPNLFFSTNENRGNILQSRIHKLDVSNFQYVQTLTDFDNHTHDAIFDDEFIVRLESEYPSRFAHPKIYKKIGQDHKKLPLVLPKRDGNLQDFYDCLDFDGKKVLAVDSNGWVAFIDDLAKHADHENKENHVYYLDLCSGTARINPRHAFIANGRAIISIVQEIPNVHPDGKNLYLTSAIMFDFNSSHDGGGAVSKLPQLEILSLVSPPVRPPKASDKLLYLVGDVDMYKQEHLETIKKCQIVAESYVMRTWANHLYWQDHEGTRVCSAFQPSEKTGETLDVGQLKEVAEFFDCWCEFHSGKRNAIFGIEIPHLKTNQPLGI